jgi:hypothetical protein
MLARQVDEVDLMLEQDYAKLLGLYEAFDHCLRAFLTERGAGLNAFADLDALQRFLASEDVRQKGP